MKRSSDCTLCLQSPQAEPDYFRLDEPNCVLSLMGIQFKEWTDLMLVFW